MGAKVAIIGAGPAGLFAAKELVEHGYDVVVYDKGRDIEDRICTSKNKKPCSKCNPCNILCGIGGAGTFSDGKMNFHHKIGGELLEFVGSEEKAYKLISEVEKTFLEYGAPLTQDYDKEKAEKLKKDALVHGITFIPIRQTHIGSDKLPELIKSFRDDLKRKGVSFVKKTEIIDFKIVGNFFNNIKRIDAVLAKKEGAKSETKVDYVVFAPGRGGEERFIELGLKYNFGLRYQAIDIGVRIETRNEIMADVVSINYDPKFIIVSKNGEQIRTFCTNPSGFVSKEQRNGYSLVNGEARKDEKSENTNFALLNRVYLNNPQSNTFEYGRKIAELFDTIGVGNPILQSLDDLVRGRRSNEIRIARCAVKPTLTDVTIADIRRAMPYEILYNLLSALNDLSYIIPGLNIGTNVLIYAPEIKFNSMRPELGESLESKTIENLYFAGDGAGLTRGIVQAAVTGLIAANGIVKKQQSLKNKTFSF